MVIFAHTPNPGLVPGLWWAEESTCSNSLKRLSSLSGGIPQTVSLTTISIAASPSAQSPSGSPNTCAVTDGSARSILDIICSEGGDGSLSLPWITNDVSWGVSRVHVDLQLAPDRLQPTRAIARPSAFVSFGRTDKHKSPHEGYCENQTVCGMPFPCERL